MEIVLDDSNDSTVDDNNNSNLSKTAFCTTSSGASSDQSDVNKCQASSLTYRILEANAKREANKFSPFALTNREIFNLGNLIESEFTANRISSGRKESTHSKILSQNSQTPGAFSSIRSKKLATPSELLNDHHRSLPSPPSHFQQDSAASSSMLSLGKSLDSSIINSNSSEFWNLFFKKNQTSKPDYKQQSSDEKQPTNTNNVSAKASLASTSKGSPKMPKLTSERLSALERSQQQKSRNETSHCHQAFSLDTDLISQARSYGRPSSRISPDIGIKILGPQHSHHGLTSTARTKATLVNMDKISALPPQLLASLTQQRRDKTSRLSPEQQQFTPVMTPFIQNYMSHRQKMEYEQ